MARITIKNLWTDTDSMMKPEIAIQSTTNSTRIDFYAYPEELQSFAQKLQGFDGSEPIMFEYGAEENMYCHFQLKVTPIDLRGHSAFEIKFDNRRDLPEKASGHFYVPANPATVNDFGRSVGDWLENATDELEYEWNDT